MVTWDGGEMLRTVLFTPASSVIVFCKIHGSVKYTINQYKEKLYMCACINKLFMKSYCVWCEKCVFVVIGHYQFKF